MTVWMIVMAPLLAFAATLLLTPVNIVLSRKTGLLEPPRPDSTHKAPMPLAGGLAVALPVLVLQVVYWQLSGHAKDDMPSLVAGGAAMALVGLLDDRVRLRAWSKLALQCLVVLGVMALGFRIHFLTNPFGGYIELGWFSLPVTLAWFLLVMNSFNLIDGMDGLAAGIAVIVCLVLGVVAFIFANPPVAILSFMLAGAVLAFLRFNFPPARIFMGDTGSLFIGYNIAAIAITGSGQIKGIAAMTLLIPITSLFLPLFDTALAVLRRLRKRQHIFHRDQEHIHHRLLRFGFSQRGVVLIAWFVTLLFGLIAIGFSLATHTLMVVVLLLLALLLMALFYVLQRWLYTFSGKQEKNE